MPRKQRLEYPGAIYHIINRGNYRRPIFETDKTKKATTTSKIIPTPLSEGSAESKSQQVASTTC